MIRPTIRAEIAETRTIPADVSFACLAKIFFSFVIRSTVDSIEVLRSSQARTKAIAKMMKSHSIKLILSMVPKVMARIVNIVCILKLG